MSTTLAEPADPTFLDLSRSRVVGRYFDAQGKLLVHVRGGATGDPDPEPKPDPDPKPDPEPKPDPDPNRLPDDHPLVKAHLANKAKLADERAKRQAAEKERNDLRQKDLPPEDQKLEEAKEAGRKEAAEATGRKLAAAEIKAALTGVVEDPAALVEDLDLSKFLDDDHDVDDAKVAALKAKYVGLVPEKKPVKDLGQGRRQTADGKPSVSSGKDLFEDRRKKK